MLLGERQLYYLLCALDPEFSELFKIAADFEEEIERTPEGERLYARLLATVGGRERLRPLDRGAAALAVEQASRRAADSEKLQVHAETLVDLLREADHLAAEAGAAVVTASHVQAALDAQVRRAGRVRERIHEEIRRGTILIDTEGEAVGQVNGLSVLQLGGFAFGRPSRITARVRLGSGNVVDIEKEVALGGPLHSKGVLILSGFLGQRFASERPLSLAASLVFEQSYSGVEGDSASCAELVALLSALAELPVRQGRAITGSVNQHGQVQPIGGVNEKIEGFFDVCRVRGLTGDQGVLIPASNVKHLMLREDVVEAAEPGRFQVWPVATVDEALELLTGVPAGVRAAGRPLSGRHRQSPRRRPAGGLRREGPQLLARAVRGRDRGRARPSRRRGSERLLILIPAVPDLLAKALSALLRLQSDVTVVVLAACAGLTLLALLHALLGQRLLPPRLRRAGEPAWRRGLRALGHLVFAAIVVAFGGLYAVFVLSRISWGASAVLVAALTLGVFLGWLVVRRTTGVGLRESERRPAPGCPPPLSPRARARDVDERRLPVPHRRPSRSRRRADRCRAQRASGLGASRRSDPRRVADEPRGRLPPTLG